MLGRRLPKNRRFDYTPLYYDPEKEAKEKRGIKFKRNYNAARARAKQRSLVWLLVLAGMVYYLIHLFSRMAKP
jgi:hypothetical protein